MKSILILATGVTLSLSSPLWAQADASAGAAAFKSCKACHTISNGDEVIVKGGRIGPNLYGVIGRAAGSTDFKYSKSMVAAGEAGLVWTEEILALFIADPSAFLKEFTGDSKARSKMSIKVKKGTADMAAYLATVSPDAGDSGDS